MGMGSGKGQSRRALAAATTSSPARAAFQGSKWQSFVMDSIPERTSLNEYYCHGRQSPLSVKKADLYWNKLATDLFLDAVTVGAISIPGQYSPEDFEFRQIPTVPVEDGHEAISLKNKPRRQEALPAFSVLDDHGPMTNSSVVNLINEMADGVNRLITS
jgi:hypothetical protein